MISTKTTRKGPITASLILIGSLALASPSLAVTQWAVAPQPDAITWEVAQGAALITGHCAKFSADIHFDPAALAGSSVRVVVDTSSCQTGTAQTDTYLPQEGWFNVAAFPQAIFEAKRFQHAGGDNYSATGTLTMKGMSKDVVLPFALTVDGDKAHAVGGLTLQRLAFGIGSGAQLSSPDVAGPDVKVKIDLHATRQQ